MRIFISSLLILFIPAVIVAQDNFSGPDTLSLKDLMNIKITVASVKELTPRESPGVVTYLTAEDIRISGARDLMEVLENIPGFQFGTDVEGVVGVALRGNWVHEGKILLLIDGHEMNENLYSTLQFGNHYAVENIERIEIIRGPGSAMYGGNAAHGVINIITRQPYHKNELKASASTSVNRGNFLRNNADIYFGKKTKEGRLMLNAGTSKSIRGTGTYRDVYGSEYPMLMQSDIRNSFVNIITTTGNLKVKGYADLYQLDTRDDYGIIVPKPYAVSFNSYNAEISYDFNPVKGLLIQPRINYNYQLPWYSDGTSGQDTEDPTLPYKVSSERATGTIRTVYDPSEYFNLSGGVTWFSDVAKQIIDSIDFSNEFSNSFRYNTTAMYLQALCTWKKLNFIAGFRYNHNEMYGSSLVPRFGITMARDRYHVKALYSKSFRSPSTDNITISPDIKSESTDVAEIEAGTKIGNDAYLTLNAFNIRSSNVILYYYDPVPNSDQYINGKYSGSYGAELEFRLRRYWGSISTAASAYTADDHQDLQIYTASGLTEEHIGVSRFKSNTLLSFNLGARADLSFGYIYTGKRTGIGTADENDNLSYKTYQPEHILNIHSDFRPSFMPGLSLRFSVINILDTEKYIIQPYNSYHAALPATGREFQIKLTWCNFN